MFRKISLCCLTDGGKVARVELNLIAFQLGRCSLITPDLHNSPNNCLSKRKYQPRIPGGPARITANAPTNIQRPPMTTAKRSIRSKNPAGWNTRGVFVFISRSNGRNSQCACLTSSVKLNKQERSRNPGGADRSGESGRARRVRFPSAALRAGMRRSTETWRSVHLLPPQPGSCGPSTKL